MKFNNYARKEVSYEKKMRIAENKTKVEMTLECIHTHLPNAIIHKAEVDSLCKQIASIVDLFDKSNYFINPEKGLQTWAQEEMMNEIERIRYDAEAGIKMNFTVDMMDRKYRSACKEENIGDCLGCFYPVNAAKPIILLLEDNQPLGLRAYVGTPSREGLAYLFVEEKIGSLFIQLQEFHFLSLKKDPVHNYDHGLLLSYNPEWGWKNISFSIILKENQDMVRQLFDSVRSAMKPIEQPNSDELNIKNVRHSCPWQ